MLTIWSQWTACSEECDSRMGVTTRERTCEHGMIGEDGCDESAYQSQFCNQDVPCRKLKSAKIDHDFFLSSILGLVELVDRLSRNLAKHFRALPNPKLRKWPAWIARMSC